MKPYLLPFLALLLACGPEPTQQAPAEPAPQPVFNRLVWSDEFSYTGLPDSTRWLYETGYVRNRELQYYTAHRPENARVEGGYLILEARHDSALIDGEIRPITSASLHTNTRAEWTYGRIEVRAQVPASLGTWPAAWLLGNDISVSGWPRCGEIDIMEHVGYMPDSFHVNVHTEAYNHTKGTHKGAQFFTPDPTGFHTFAVEWQRDRLDFYHDGQWVFAFEKESDAPEVWPFQHSFYLILNLAFGGSWGGARGVDVSSLPQRYVIDWVRVYQ